MARRRTKAACEKKGGVSQRVRSCLRAEMSLTNISLFDLSTGECLTGHAMREVFNLRMARLQIGRIIEAGREA